ncbi:hypothetical protein PGT21_012473 [Puccinia graminis f. sp. tritici]|uniref:Uncharacterized protein n=1 Tax=Puccinia graminis f. sp. tritici TaxID=56615 RepID=A0A5B0P429_PUCGR|nr:hypothetical protein PGT21_012473 [Puccinia graminis f. sp. tritici]KAA1132121.1 hypothetical protein PGTUg99_037246 [Puccinia graminis f. sp. tritici]
MRSTLAILLVSLVLCHMSIAQNCPPPNKCTCTISDPPKPASDGFCAQGCCVPPSESQ